MVFRRNFCEKRQILVSEPHLEESRGDARPWLIIRWKVYGRLSIHVNWTSVAIYYSFGVKLMRRKVYSSGVFTAGSTYLHSNFTGQGRPH